MNTFDVISNSEMFIQIMWYISLSTTLIFLIQTLIVFFGGDHDSYPNIDNTDMNWDHNFDYNYDRAQNDTGASFQWFTFRNLIAFLMFFSWGTIGAYQYGYTIAIVIGLILGIGMTVIITFLYYLIGKLQTNNIPKIESIVGKSATVYLRIPKKGSGAGKINVTLNGSLQTIDAESADDNYSTGASVKVIGIKDGRIAIVSKDV